MAAALASLTSLPDVKINLRSTFNNNITAFAPAFSRRTSFVPQSIPNFHFDRSATICILFGLMYNKRVLLVGEHGSAKSAHVEQVCSKLNWPCVRLNLDEHLTKLEFSGLPSDDVNLSLIFKYALLPWAMRRPMALIVNASGALKPESITMLTKLLKVGCKLSPPQGGGTIEPNSCFRIFATCDSPSDMFQTGGVNYDEWQLVANLPTRNPFRPSLCDLALAKLKIVVNLLRKLKTKSPSALTCRMSHSWNMLRFMFNDVHDTFLTNLRKSPCTPALINTFGQILRGASFYSETALSSAIYCTFR